MITKKNPKLHSIINPKPITIHKIYPIKIAVALLVVPPVIKVQFSAKGYLTNLATYQRSPS